MNTSAKNNSPNRACGDIVSKNKIVSNGFVWCFDEMRLFEDVLLTYYLYGGTFCPDYVPGIAIEF
jgi:hypothetical protein